MQAEKFRALIRETYITPIRSVLIIDDDYPTLEEVLTAPKKDKRWHSNPKQIEKVIAQFRADHQPMNVDIHDGSNVGMRDQTKAVKRLHQSDLLVLDYELDRSKKGDGTKAIKITRNILENHHFNLMVLHTRENLERVFREMLLALLPRAGLKAWDDAAKSALPMLEEAEEENVDIVTELRDCMDISHFLHAWQTGIDHLFDPDEFAPSFAEFGEICVASNWTTDEEKKTVASWVISHVGNSLSGQMATKTLSNVTWAKDGPFWIRSDSGFIAFVNKAIEGDDADETDLVTKLLEALVKWSPRPSRLFLTKLRAEIGESGGIAEDKALGTRHVHANWYLRLLCSDKANRDFFLTETLSRHSEQLLETVVPATTDFASRLVEAEDKKTEETDICLHHYGVDLRETAEKERARFEHNAFVCSKAVAGYHLAPGHVFKNGDAYWICLTPACDLVPGQKSSGRFENVGQNLPFTAVRLQKVMPPAPDAVSKIKKAYEKTYDRAMGAGRYMVLNVAGELVTLSLNRPDDESSAPHWFSLFAAKQGVFDPKDAKFKFYKNEQAKNGRLVSRSFEAKIVGQLRYEYALNLMSKLGVTMTRVGLDFQ